MKDLTFGRLREANIARCKRWHPGGVDDWSVSDWVTATTGELGEAANVVKKLNRVRDGIGGNKETEEQLREQLAMELADTVTYLDLWAEACGVDLAAAVAEKFNIVSARNGFPDRLELFDHAVFEGAHSALQSQSAVPAGHMYLHVDPPRPASRETELLGIISDLLGVINRAPDTKRWETHDVLGAILAQVTRMASRVDAGAAR